MHLLPNEGVELLPDSAVNQATAGSDGTDGLVTSGRTVPGNQ